MRLFQNARKGMTGPNFEFAPLIGGPGMENRPFSIKLYVTSGGGKA
jgi:hypothetical protein